MTEHAHTNRLSEETSPYLRQHAHNPVDWFPWGPKALRLAQLQDKPILLSVGYAACHWCHVMAHESFEDEATAELMNRFFVCVKVDREERPDIDELYMRAVQAITGGGGGWPMTVFLTPQGQPFYGGTYFPPQPRNGLPGFKQTLAHVHLLWKQNRPEVERIVEQVTSHLEEGGRMPRPADALKGGWLDVLADAADKSYDEEHGGFGGAPKFPPHATLAGLLAHWRFTGQNRSLDMVTGTLDAMTRGAMYDLVGGGFCRYSVDAEWRVPHFEKMLYDNAQLVPVLADAWKATRNASYARIARETVDWLMAEMLLPEGGFCASLDADSGGVEGGYYAWTPAQLEAVLGAEAAKVAELLQVKPDEPEGSVLRLETPLEQSPERNLLAQALLMMQGARSRRVAPGRDDKVITAWNAMTIRALAYGGVALNEPTWIEAARRAADFLLTTLVQDGRLLRTWREGEAHTLAYADDYALLTDALTELYQATFDVRWLREAIHLADETLRLFWNEEQGSLFYAGHDAEALITRSANPLGGAVPSANGAAAHAFTRLAALCGREDLGEHADSILRSFQRLLDRAPRALGSEAITAAWRAGRGRELALVGPKPGALLAQARRHVEPTMVMAFGTPEAAPLVPWLADKEPLDEQPTAYLCEGQSCKAPTTDPDALAALLAVAPGPSLPTDLHRDAAPALPEDPSLWLNTPQPIRLDELHGQVVVLWFWAASSVASLRTLAQLQALTRDLSDQPVRLVGVHAGFCEADDDANWVRDSLARLGVTHPTLRDPVKQVWRQYAAAAWPTVMVLDAHGQVAWAEASKLDPKKLRIAVERMLEEARAEGILGSASPAPAQTPATTTGPLCAPAKVRCWPGAAAQEAGADPFGEDARLYIADTGHHQVIEARVERAKDGWPAHVAVLRRFGTGEATLQDGSVPAFHSPRGLDRADDTLWIADTGNDALRALDLRTGEARTARAGLAAPWDVSVAEAGTAAEQALVFAAVPGARQLWVHLPQTGQTGPMAGSGKDEHIDGAPHEAALASPRGVELFGQYLFFVDSSVHSVRVMDMADQKLRTLIGKTRADYGDVDGTGDDARMRLPQGITAGHGAVYVADTLNHKIKAIGMADRAVRTLCAAEVLRQPEGLTLAGDFLIVADPTAETLFVVHRETGELRPLPVR